MNVTLEITQAMEGHDCPMACWPEESRNVLAMVALACAQNGISVPQTVLVIHTFCHLMEAWKKDESLQQTVDSRSHMNIVEFVMDAAERGQRSNRLGTLLDMLFSGGKR